MVRVLFSYAGGSGHADPIVPVADAVHAAGHTVAFFGRRSAATMLLAHGFTLFADPDDPALTTADPDEIAPLLEIDMDREYRDLRVASPTGSPAAEALASCDRQRSGNPTSSFVMRPTSAA